jgi:branched-chain amino acid transport system permease protein
MLAQLLLNGCVTGLLLALPALALTIVFGVLKFPNFAIGSMLTVGAYAAWVMNSLLKMPLIASAALAALTVAAVAVLGDYLVFARLRDRGSITLLVASMGVSLVLENICRFAFGNGTRDFDIEVARPIRWHGLRVNHEQVITVVVVFACVALIQWLIYATPVGRAMRAVADNPALAAVRGVERQTIARVAWALAGGLIALAGVLAGLDRAIDPLLGWNYQIPIFAAAILGGLGSPVGAVVGAVVIGVTEELSTLVLPTNYRQQMIAYLTTLVVLVSVAALVGLALNFQWGVAGLVNFGVVGFVAVGAYTTALLGPSLGWFSAMLAAAAICATASTALAFLSIRLEDNYLAIVTIGFGEIVRILLLNESWLTGGALGIADIPRPFTSFVGATHYDVVLLGFAVVLVAAVFVLLETLVRSPFGRVLRAVRDDPIAASALGKPVLLLRVKAFAIGGAVMGLAGSLHAFYLTYIDPGQFTSIITAYAFMAVIAGGRGSNIGLLIGASTVMVLIEATRFLKDMLQVIDGAQLSALRLGAIGAGIILLLILRPQGMLPEPHRRARDILADGDAAPDNGGHP